MAILVASIVVPPDPDPDPGDPGDPGTPPVVDAPDNWTGTPLGPYLTWTSALGRVTNLEDYRQWDRGIMALPGVLGLGMPGYSFFEDASPAFDGATVRGTPRANPRDITVPIHIWARTRAEAKEIWGQFVFDLNPQNGSGILTVYERDGTSRQIPAYYSQGMEGSADDSDGAGPTWWTFAAVFHASRPYWLGNQRQVVYQIAGGGSFFPLLPLVVTDSSPGGSVHISNNGDTDSFPTWTVRGPATSLTLTNVTTGKSFTIDYALSPGDTLVIDTTDGNKFVKLNGSVNLWPSVTLGSNLWSLRGGVNELIVAAPAATAQTSVTLSFRERFLTAG